MKAKEYLSQVYYLSEELRQNQTRLEELETEIGGLKAIDYSGVKVQTSPKDKLVECIDKLSEIYGDIMDETVKLQLMKRRVQNEINSLEDPSYIGVLSRRYIEEKKWELIAVEMGYGIRWVHRLHGMALQAFEDKYLKSHINSP